MGFLWDLIQQGQLASQSSRTGTLEARVAWLEREQERSQGLLMTLIRRLEEKFGEDIDRDGRVG